MNKIIAHLIRGVIAVVLIALAFALAQTQPVLAITAGVLAVIAMQGCPACWIFGLILTIGETIRGGGSGSSTA